MKSKISALSLFLSLATHSNLVFSQVDPLAGLMWHLGFVGYPLNQNDYPDHINLSDAHDFYTGEGIVVVVSDDGLETDHPDLSSNVLTQYSRNYSLASPYLGEPVPAGGISNAPHGTFVSGHIGSLKNNGIGGFGVAPASSLVGFQFLNSTQDLPRQISQATLTQAHVFNYSYATNCSSIYPTQRSYITVLKNNSFRMKQIYVTAAGNNAFGDPANFGSYLGNHNFDQNKAYPFQIVVGSLGGLGGRAYYSNPGSNIWVSAPGGDSSFGFPIFSTDLSGCDVGYSKSSNTDETFNINNGVSEFNQNCDYAHGQGTSYASPVVAGVVALIKEANPALSFRDIKHILAYTADPIDLDSVNLTHPLELNLAGHIFDPGWVTNFTGFPFHNWYGFGKVNAAQALIMANPKTFNLGNWITTELPDGSSFYKTGTLNLNVPDNSATGVSHSISVSKHRLNIEHVRVRVNITHPFPSDVGIELTSPKGTKSVLKYINDRMVGTNISATFGTNAFYLERSEGTWRIKIIDGAGADIGKLVSWQIFIDGNDSVISGARPTITAPKVPVKAVNGTGNKITITPASQTGLLRHEACIYVSGTCNEVDWFPLTSLSFTLSHYSKSGVFTAASTIKKGAYFNVAVRAVNTSEKRTSPKVFRLLKR